jgi:lactate racemase
LEHAGKVYIYSSGLTAEDATKMGVTKVDDLQGTIDRLLKEDNRSVVVPDGPYVVGRVR